MDGNTLNRFTRILKVLWRKVKEYTYIKEDTDYEATVDFISKSVVFRGFNVWILFFAIIVASVGLNVNSTAVIIGAMLISPLMGPINGVGLAIGTFDEPLLRKSLKNLIFMVFISIVASTLYFLLSPISNARSELLARTQPTIFDVFIAFFGGLAGIVATSRKSQSITVISGVAIATALMPPLCTAGYGIATGQIWYFLGASYLFFINSFFIALATFITVRLLGFPEAQYVDERRSRKVKRIITIFTLIVLVPSIYLAVDVIREAAFNTQSQKFVNEIQDSEMLAETEIIKSDREYHHRSQSITLILLGKQLEEAQVLQLQNILHNEYGLKKTNLIIKQSSGKPIDTKQQNELIEDLIDKKDKTIRQQDSIIHELRRQLEENANTD
ncbi:MAG: DUF389 domain-containing protein [Bacteroidales bacterium]|nr:DUF389 domain-containing protein [Bacteroidales bacterium]